ncbi:MAG: hypothetical protein QG629_445 [Patescibacteria group bacterium]|nr:hypothetical protein [Candidatus Saccharibacteria bacterium]MDQ5963363.1 hypothetical protein [Patescibacteria group bacterium]
MAWQPIDYIGLLGGLILLFAFWRVTSGVWKATSVWYELDNVAAAILLIVYAYEKKAYVNILLNLVWTIVAMRGLSSYAERRLRRDPSYRRGFRRGQKLRKQL